MKGKTDRKWTAGDLDRKVQISHPVITIDTDTKYEVKSFSDEIEVYANVVHNNLSKEAQVNGGIIYDDVITVVIRYKSEFESTKMRLRYKDRNYDVLSAREVYGRRQWLILKCSYARKELNTGI